MAKLPTIKALRALFVDLKKGIDADYRAGGCEDDSTPSMDVTIGWSDETGEWDYQTGDNSYHGAAYFYPHWAIVTLHRTSNSTELARDVRAQLAES